MHTDTFIERHSDGSVSDGAPKRVVSVSGAILAQSRHYENVTGTLYKIVNICNFVRYK